MSSGLLLENGANPNERNDLGKTPLQAASSLGSLEMVLLLLKYGADIEVEDE
jgi:hypothetical protein